MDKLQFIKQVLPDDGWVNVREIDAEGKAQNKYFTLEGLAAYNPPNNKNIYYGIFTRKDKSGTAAYCNKTFTIWADYDNVTLDLVKERIGQAQLPKPSLIVNSGHGIHCYWLLDQPVGAEVTSIVKGIVRATGADQRAIDIARVMRLPDTYNVKNGESVKCEVIENNGQRYKLDIFKAFAQDGPYQEQHVINIVNLSNSNRPCIRSMAAGVKEGHRNFALGRITKYLQAMGKTKEQSIQTILQWNSNNNPPEGTDKLIRDFEAYWKGDYKLLGCTIKNTELQSILGDYCNRSECALNMTIGRLRLDNTAKYNNRLFRHIHNMTGNHLIIYGVLIRHSQGLTTSQLVQKLTGRSKKQCCVVEKTRLECLKYLESLNLIQVIQGNRRAGKENFYKAIPQGTYGTGYTIVTNGAINGAIDGRVTPSEFKLYILLLKYAFGKDGCYPSLDTLAKDLRVDISHVSKCLTNLEKYDYIRKEHTYPNNKEKLVMTLLV